MTSSCQPALLVWLFVSMADFLTGANALVLASSVVKLTDFGCCRVCGDEASCLPGPAGGDFKPLSGTVPFMAPEGSLQLTLAVQPRFSDSSNIAV